MSKIRTLHVRPQHSADLAFETPGIVGSRNQAAAQLGQRVTTFGAAPLIARFSTRTATGRHEFDGPRIRRECQASFLFALRNDLLEAHLQQAVAQCELAYLDRYKHRDKMAAALRKVYPPDASVPEGKLQRLEELRALADRQTAALKSAYENLQWKDVISDTITQVRNLGDTISTTFLTPVAMYTPPHTIRVTNSPVPSEQQIPQTTTIPRTWVSNDDWTDVKTPSLGFASQKTVSTNDLTHVSTTRNTEFRHPYLENAIQEQRAQLSLQDEILAHEATSFRIPDAEAMIDREHETIDWEVRKTQVRFFQSFLAAPFDGIVTAVYKDVGDSVQAGEPVIRVENDDAVFLVGVVQHRGLVRVGDELVLRCRSLFEAGTPMSAETVFTSRVVAVRGHDSDDDEWDLIARCENPDHVLPINFHFDRETTRVEISRI